MPISSSSVGTRTGKPVFGLFHSASNSKASYTHFYNGVGTKVGTFIPHTQIGTETGWVDVSSESDGSLAVRSDGTLWGWGGNFSYMLTSAAGTPGPLTPTQIGSVNTWSRVSTALYGSTLALRTDGTLWGVGANGDGQLGVGNYLSQPSFIQVGTGTTWSGVSMGVSHAAAIKTDGTIWCWGNGIQGQIGNGGNIGASSPVQVGTGTSWTNIKCSNNSTYALRSDGTIWSWGSNGYGELGDGTNTNRNSPVQVGTGTSWSKIFAGQNSVAAIQTNGTMWAWGANSYTQLGDGTATNRSSPVQIGTGTNWSEAHYTDNGRLAITTDGKMWRSGDSSEGALGDYIIHSGVTQVGSSTGWYKPVGRSTSIVLNNGRMYSCGSLVSAGQGARVLLVDEKKPVVSFKDYTSSFQEQITDRFSEIDAGGAFSYAVGIKPDGKLFSWGKIVIGDNTLRSPTAYYGQANYSPTGIATGSTWSVVSAGQTHIMGIKTDKTLWGWGQSNIRSEIGDGTNTPRIEPVQVGTGAVWADVVAGFECTLAIRTDGTLWGWGLNTRGQLGIGSTVNATGVGGTQVGTGTWSKVSITKQSLASEGTSSRRLIHSLGIQTNGTLWGWGYNLGGQVGDGTTTQRTSPVQIGTGTNWADIAAGKQYSVAVKTDGTLWTWGRNTLTSLYVIGYQGRGEGVSNNITTVPTQVGTGTFWSKVYAGPGEVIATTTDGQAYGWGSNSSNQLGLGTGVYRVLTPTKIPIPTGATSVQFAFSAESNADYFYYYYNYYDPSGSLISSTLNETLAIFRYQK